MRRQQLHRRRAAIYVMVLGCTMAVTVIGLSAITALRINRRSAEQTGDFAQARLYAQSAIEMGFLRIANDPDWRTTYPNGIWDADRPIGAGTYTLEGTDPDGLALDDDDADPLLLTGIGMQGDARYKLQVTVVPEYDPLPCLAVSLHTGNDLFFDASLGSITTNGDQIISSNTMIRAVTGGSGPSATTVTVHPAMEAANGYSGTLGPGAQSTLDPPRQMPDEATVFDYYEDDANSTLIDSLNLPGDASVRYLQGVVLSPNSNPYGPTDPNGVYRIDCRGSELWIGNCRIVGTLVLINASSTTLISNFVNWEPAVPNYPALLMRGTMRMWQGSAPLDEGVLGVNFNPPGTPYQGSEDGLLDDQYPSVIRGLIYVSGDLSLPASNCDVVIDGVLIVGNTFIIQSSNSANLSLGLTYDQRYYDNPPPGFTEPPRMVVSPGTWRRVVN